MDSTGIFQGIFNQSTLNVDVGDFIIAGLADNKVVGAVSSHLTTDNVSTDWLTEGPTNQYFTTTRARAAFSSVSPVNIVAGQISLGYSGSIRLNGSSLDTIQPIETTSSPQFAGLTLTGLSGVLKAVAGVIQQGATTDDLTEGKTNLYFTDTRARGSFSAGTNITVAAGVIATTSNPTFSVGATIGTLNITNMTSNITNGLSLGTSAGTANDANVYLGHQTGMSATGNGNVGVGYQSLFQSTGAFSVAVGLAAGLNSKTNGNVCIGSSTGQNILTGSGYNVYIGSGVPSSSSASYEIVIGGSPTGVVGKGNSTCFISAGSGLYVSNLTAGVLKSSSTGLITSNATTDDLTEGKTNLYFTNARAQGAFSPGTNITLAAGVIATTSNPTFSVGATIGTLNITSMTSNITNGLSLGTSAGTAGNYNVYLGHQTGTAATGDANVAVGLEALANATGDDNVAVGWQALTGATGSSNVGVGYQSLFQATGNNSVAVGLAAGYNTKTNGNVCIGTSTGQNILTGSGYNVYIGSGVPSSSSASYEIVLGGHPAGITGKGDNTCFISASSGLYVSNLTAGVLKSSATGLITSNATTDDLTEGKTNLYFTDTRARAAITATTPIKATSGVISLDYQTTNLTLTASKLDTIQDIDTLSSPQFARLLSSSLSTRNVLCGTNSGAAITSGVDCVAIGHNALTAITTAGTSTAVGSQALRYATGGSNTGVGFYVLRELTTGNQNTALGAFAGSLITTGSFNTLMGQSAGYNITSGSTNYCLGLNAGYSISSSSDNIALGAYSMAKNLNPITITNGRNIAIGHYASHSLAGSPANNITIGYNSMYNATAPSNNVCIGTDSGNSITTGGGNICIGGASTSTGGTLTSGNGYNIGVGIASNLYVSAGAENNIGLGAYSNFNTSTGSSNISIGLATQASTATGSNQITISTNGTLAAPISGRGNNTALIDARNGLYSYSPAYWWGYAKTQTSGILEWIPYSDRKAIALKVGDATQLLLPYIGLYDIALSGNIYVGAVSQNLDVYVNGSLYLQNACFYQTITGWTSCSLNVIVPAYSVNTYVQFTLSASLGTATSIQLFLKAKFLSLM